MRRTASPLRLMAASFTPLAHPVAVLAAALLLLNDHIWQPLAPSWWTGKLSDAAWLVVAPLLALAALGALPPLRRLAPRTQAAAICALAALAFALVKAVPAANLAALALGARLGLALKLRLDPTDLLALPAVLLAGWVWQHPPHAPRRTLRAAAVGLALLAVAADVAAPHDYGITCVAQDGTTLAAVREIQQPSEGGSGNRVKSVYRSSDGGRSWSLDSQADAGNIDCSAQPAWPVADPSNPSAQLYDVPGKGIYHSSDQGRTLTLEQPLAYVPGAVVDSATGNLVLAAGNDGIWVKTRAGQWLQGLTLPTH